MIGRVAAAVASAGLIQRGGFRPKPEDKVPDLPGGRAARTLVLVGNAGHDMWRAFLASGPRFEDPHPLDAWLTPFLRDAAATLGGAVVLPKEGPPYPPFQRWAQRAEPVRVSPLGLLIHPEYGLWHAYRAAFLFAEDLDLPPIVRKPSPCESCAEKPCLSACPASAFETDGFNAERCAAHAGGSQEPDCLGNGCFARRVCPVGANYRYTPDQERFHLEKFLAAMDSRRA